MHKISHQNIVRLYGVVLETKTVMLVNELAPLKSLLECLKECSLRSTFPVMKLCDYAQQIADGMAYLESKRLIHRDLAARNILVFSTDKVKISDFGLSRALGVGEEYYRSNFSVNLKLPIAWCAPECITFLKFTSASDVWAFGVTLWEMFTYGFQPWAGMNGQQILDAIDSPKSQRLEIPESCPQEFYSLMLQCWEHDPNNRPKFTDIQHVFPEIRPDRVQAICQFSDNQWDHLQYSNGTIITVLHKRPKEYPDGYYWKGALDNGKVGLFLPSNTVAYFSAEFPSLPPDFRQNPGLSGSLGNIQSSFSKGGSKTISNTAASHNQHQKTDEKKIDRRMISKPQGDLRHTAHLGLDGSCFGEIAASIQKNNLPKQVVAPLVMSERARSCTNSPMPLARFPVESIPVVDVPAGPSPGLATGSVAGTGRMESTTSETALLISGEDSKLTAIGASENYLDPMVSTAELEREIGRDSPDLDVPKFENNELWLDEKSGPSLLDEVFEELERGSMSSRLKDDSPQDGIVSSRMAAGRGELRSMGQESEISEPTSPTASLHPADTTDTTRLLSQRGRVGQSSKQTTKPEALVRPLSFSDARLLNDFTQMAQKMSDRAFRLDREQRAKQIEEKLTATAMAESLQISPLSPSAPDQDQSPTGKRDRSPPKLKDRLARLKLSRSNSREESPTAEDAGGEGSLTSSSGGGKCFSDILPKKGVDMFATTKAWSPMAEDAYKSLIEYGTAIAQSSPVPSSRQVGDCPIVAPVREEGQEGDTRRSLPKRVESLDRNTGAEDLEEEEESNPLRLLRKDAVGVARSFKPGGSRRGRAAFIAPPLKADNTAAGFTGSGPISGGGRTKAPPPVPPKPSPSREEVEYADLALNGSNQGNYTGDGGGIEKRTKTEKKSVKNGGASPVFSGSVSLLDRTEDTVNL